MKQPNYFKIYLTVSLIIAAYLFLLIVLIQVEGRHPKTTIHSFSDGLWFLVATLTSVGYGDATPASVPGRIIGFIGLNR
jgi:voltage-gated potassium channel